MRSLLFVFLLTITPPVFAGTLVEIRLPIGTIGLELYDADKPITVSNFLNYITSGRYQNTFAHRLEPGFVLQGGGFNWVGNTIDYLDTFAAIQNEYSAGATYSNTYGTIAMARVGGNVNSATSQWFINLGNNAGLDTVDEGFTVFGRVISGFDVLTRLNTTFADANIETDGVFNATAELDSNFGHLPLLYRSLERDAALLTDIVVVPEPGSTTLFVLGAGICFLPVLRRRFHAAHRAH